MAVSVANELRHTRGTGPTLEDELGPAVLDACSSLLREYSELSNRCPEFSLSKRDLLCWYAELQFKLRGGGKCSHCRAAVRHALKVRAERQDGSMRTYLCLCTRCLVAEEAVSNRILYRVGGEWVESHRAAGLAPTQVQRQAA